MSIGRSKGSDGAASENIVDTNRMTQDRPSVLASVAVVWPTLFDCGLAAHWTNLIGRLGGCSEIHMVIVLY